MVFYLRKSLRLTGQKGLSTIVLGLSLAILPISFMMLGNPVQVSAKQDLPNPFANKHMLTRLASGTVRRFKFPDQPKPPVDVSFFDEKGKKHTLSEWHGKTVLINFWAPWCDACRRELPSLDILRKRLDRQEFEVISINIEDDVKKGRDYLNKLGLTRVTSMLDKGMTAIKKLDAIGIPTNILIDCHGRELGRLKGSAVWHADAAILLTKGMMRAAGCYNDKQDIL
jgi:thiol-disulfide isomerase/thioredoxin